MPPNRISGRLPTEIVLPSRFFLGSTNEPVYFLDKGRWLGSVMEASGFRQPEIGSGGRL